MLHGHAVSQFARKTKTITEVFKLCGPSSRRALTVEELVEQIAGPLSAELPLLHARAMGCRRALPDKENQSAQMDRVRRHSLAAGRSVERSRSRRQSLHGTRDPCLQLTPPFPRQVACDQDGLQATTALNI